jgi:hypothetical protein
MLVGKFKEGIVTSLQTSTPVKYDITLKPNIVVTGSNTEQAQAIANVINKFDLTASVFISNEGKEQFLNLKSKFNNKTLVELDYIAKDKLGYLKASPFLEKYLGSELAEDAFASKVKNEDIITIVNALESAYLASVKEEYFEKTDATVKVNGEDVSVKANTLNLNEQNIKPFMQSAAKKLSENQEFLNAATAVVNAGLETSAEMSSSMSTMAADETLDTDAAPGAIKLTETDLKNTLVAIAEGKDTTFNPSPIKYTIYVNGKDPVGMELSTKELDLRVVFEDKTIVVYTSVIKDNKKTNELTELVRIKTEGEKYTITATTTAEDAKVVVALEMTVKETKDYKVTAPTVEQIYTEEETLGVVTQLLGAVMTGQYEQLIAKSEGATELLTDPVMGPMIQALLAQTTIPMGPGNVMGEADTTTPEAETTPETEVVPENSVVETPVVETPVENETVQTNPSTLSE